MPKICSLKGALPRNAKPHHGGHVVGIPFRAPHLRATRRSKCKRPRYREGRRQLTVRYNYPVLHGSAPPLTTKPERAVICRESGCYRGGETEE